MKKICLFTFSGSGMTARMTASIIASLTLEGACVTSHKMEEFDAKSFNPSAFDILGVAFPVHASTNPKIVSRFLENLPNGNIPAFILASAGANHWVNNAFASHAREILSSKGYKVYFDRFFPMPENFAIKTSATEVKARLEFLKDQSPAVAKSILNVNAQSFTEANAFIRTFAHLFGGLEQWGAGFVGKRFYTNSECTLCGHCLNICPTKNIFKEEEKVKFGKSCGLCMRCIYACPNRAISIHGPFKLIVLKDWYNI